MYYNHDVYGGLGATQEQCPEGSVPMSEYGAVLAKKLAPYQKCFDQMTGNARFSGLGGLRERGQVLLYAAQGANDAWKQLGHGACVDAAQRAFLDEYVAVIGILCTYPESQALLDDCKSSIAKLEQRPAAPRACPMCPPPKRPAPCACDDKPKYGLLLGVLAAGGLTGFVLTRVLRK